MGKTSILTKLSSEAPHHWAVVQLSLEGLSTPVEITARLVEALRDELAPALRIEKALRKRLTDFGIDKVGPLTLGTDADWKSLLDRAFASVQEVGDDPAAAKLVVLLLDEVPLAAGRIRDTAGPDAARDFLDRLRAMRQANPRVRMVLTGSIGFHHVLRSLSGSGVPSAPTNDLVGYDVGGLEPDDAVLLARRLLLGERIAGDHDQLAPSIAAETAGVPFYIQHVVGALADLRSTDPLSTDDVERVIDRALVDPKDAWNTAHYLERIASYYGDRAELARRIVDVVAASGLPLSSAEVRDRLALRQPVDAAAVSDTIRLLRLDHYLRADITELQVLHPIVGRAWRALRVN
jgi:hypothetical protein